MTAAARHWIGVGGVTPRRSAQAYRMAPAIRKRVPAIRKGGIVSMAKRIARYVDPQIR